MTAHLSGASIRYILARDDFDLMSPQSAAPATPDPLPDLLAQARAEGFEAGRAAARAEAAGSLEAAATAALREAASAFALNTGGAVVMAEETAAALASALLGALAGTLPGIAARCGTAEVTRFAEHLLGALTAEPRIVLRVAPDAAPIVATHFAAEARVEVLADPALGLGDAQVAWRDGRASRQTAAACDAVMETLAGFGLRKEHE